MSDVKQSIRVKRLAYGHDWHSAMAVAKKCATSWQCTVYLTSNPSGWYIGTRKPADRGVEIQP